MSASPAPLRQRSRLPHQGRLGRAVRLISLLDRRSMRRLQNRHLPRWAQLWMLFASRFGGAFLWLCVALLVEWQGGPRRYLALSASLSACFFGLVLLLGIKPFTRRQRPHPYRRAWAPALIRSTTGVYPNSMAMDRTPAFWAAIISGNPSPIINVCSGIA